MAVPDRQATLCRRRRVQVLVNGRHPSDVDVWFLEVSPGFIETMRIRLLAGRDLTRSDYDPGSPSVVVNSGMAVVRPAQSTRRTVPFARSTRWSA